VTVGCGQKRRRERWVYESAKEGSSQQERDDVLDRLLAYNSKISGAVRWQKSEVNIVPCGGEGALGRTMVRTIRRHARASEIPLSPN